MKDRVRPIYSEFQGYLSQIPSLRYISDTADDDSVWKHYHQAIEELNEITGKNYDRYKLEIRYYPNGGGSYISIASYRSKLGGLISRLHAEYFSDELAPFSGIPSTVIQQSQNVTQQVQIHMLLEVQSKIDEKLNKPEIGEKEKPFLQKVKGSLSHVKSAIELIQLVITAAKDVGLPWGQVISLFT